MDEVTRRKAITLSVAAPTVGLGFPQGGEVDTSMIGINIKIGWMRANYPKHTINSPSCWCVWLPDFEAVKTMHWYPGMAMPGYWLPLTEYLATLEEEYLNRKSHV
jgi:hypothetical protein